MGQLATALSVLLRGSMSEPAVLSRTGSPDVIIVGSGMGGATLKKHWEKGAALRRIREAKWDFVVLQAQSSEMMVRLDETKKYATLFDREIDRAGAKTVIFETWKPDGSAGTQTALNARYIALAHAINALVAPVGSAWETLQRNGMNLFDPGGVHPNLRGSYLSACVFYATFYRADPAGATHVFETKFDVPESYRRDLEQEKISDEDAAAIQQAAWAAVSQRPRPAQRGEGGRRPGEGPPLIRASRTFSPHAGRRLI